MSTIFNIKKYLKQKKYAIIGKELLKSIDNTKYYLKSIQDKLNKDSLLKEYDYITNELTMIRWYIGRLSLYPLDDLLVEELNCLKSILNEIYTQILNIGTESKQEILNELDKIDIPHIENSKIIDTLNWIWDKLELESIVLEDTIRNPLTNRCFSHPLKGKISNCGISARQYSAYNACLKYSLDNNTHKSIRELNEFIDNYQNTLREPFNSFERLSIKTMITHILKSIK